MAQQRHAPATVLTQKEGRVRVDHDGRERVVPLAGFPPGFRLRPGERVAVVEGASGLEARPLVKAVRASLTADALAARKSLEIGAERFAMQEGTVVEEGPAPGGDGRSREYVVWIVDPGDAEGPAQVVAARRKRETHRSR